MINKANDKSLKAAWDNSLGHQIPEEILPYYENVKSELLKLCIKNFDK